MLHFEKIENSRNVPKIRLIVSGLHILMAQMSYVILESQHGRLFLLKY